MTPAAWLAIAALAAVLGTVLAVLHQTLRYAQRAAGEDWLRTIADAERRHRLRLVLDSADRAAGAIAMPRIICNLAVPVSMVMAMADHAPGGGGVTVGLGALLGGVLGASAVLWVTNVALPAAIARHAWGVTLRATLPLVRALAAPLAPVGAAYAFVDEVVRRLAGADSAGASGGEAEILTAVEQAERAGGVDPTERDMIEAVVEFRSTSVDEIMTPRTAIEALEYTDELDEVKAYVRHSHHSRIPVYRESLDDIAGFLYAKDLLKWLAEPGNGLPEHFRLADIIRDALFIPETKTVRELLREMIQQRVHIAMVADEYGGTAGLVTIEDIVEEVFGEIHDEYEDTPEDQPEVVLNLDDHTADIDAQMRIDDANDALRPLGVQLPEDEDFDTVGGYVSTRLGRIPDVGDAWEEPPLRLVVTSAEQTRVRRVRLHLVGVAGSSEAAQPMGSADEGTREQRPA